ncbi:MAG: TetR/AcrR family transcriptional regulator [Fimbriimonadaceae bacterium]|nr:TetR/AcrR family transcriptional regulator [Fimbriimonadaceae bacterium]
MAALEQQSGSTENSILDAADRLMARFGFRKMTMEDIAQEARVSRRTIYLHFKNKEDVGLSSIGRVVNGVFAEMHAISECPMTVSDRLIGVLRHRALGRLQRVREYATSLDELFEAVRPAYLQRRAEMFQKERLLIASLLQEGKASQAFHLDSPTAVADAMLLATNAFIPYSLSPDELGSPAEVTQRLDAMISLLLAGVLCERKR